MNISHTLAQVHATLDKAMSRTNQAPSHGTLNAPLGMGRSEGPDPQPDHRFSTLFCCQSAGKIPQPMEIRFPGFLMVVWFIPVAGSLLNFCLYYGAHIFAMFTTHHEPSILRIERPPFRILHDVWIVVKSEAIGVNPVITSLTSPKKGEYGGRLSHELILVATPQAQLLTP